MRIPTNMPRREKTSRNSPLKYPLTAKSIRRSSKIRSTILTMGYVGLDRRQKPESLTVPRLRILIKNKASRTPAELIKTIVSGSL